MPEYVLEMRNIDKSFPGVHALKGVNFYVKPGEIHALVGENGAGKSTLIKILAGVLQKDDGEIFVNGKQVDISNPQVAQGLGLAFIHQEINLVPYFDAVRNIFLTQEPVRKNKVINWKEMYQKAKSLLKKVGISQDKIMKPVSELSISQQQLIIIAKALLKEPSIIVFDEPTSSLDEEDRENLFETIGDLRKNGVTIIYISHRLEEIFEIADSVTVLKDGEKVCTKNIKELYPKLLVSYMIGKNLKDQFPKENVKIGEVLLEVKNLCKKGVLKDINFSLRKGEVLGVIGAKGSGKTELANILFGVDKKYEGAILLEGDKTSINSPREAIAKGIGLIPENRKEGGLILNMNIKENITLPVLNQFCNYKFINQKGENKLAEKLIKSLSIKATGYKVIVNFLSGGNQQKVVLGKWLGSKAKVLIFDEPTKGIDVYAKSEIYREINKLAQQGTAIIFISPEIPEVLGVSDRIIVFYKGSIAASFNADEADKQKLLYYSMGGRR